MRLLKGLEISVIRLSDLHYPMRIEAEYYGKEHLALEKMLDAMPHRKLCEIQRRLTDGTHYTPNYTDAGVPFLSALNVLPNRLDFSVGHQFISLTEHKILSRRCAPESGDVLLRKVGVGPRYAAVVPDGSPDFSIFVSVALIRLKTDEMLPRYLATFINSRYGQQQLLRVQKGMSQPDL